MLPLLRNAQLVQRHVGHVSREDILPGPIFAKELKEGTSYATNSFGATIEVLIKGEELMTEVTRSVVPVSAASAQYQVI